MSPALGIYVHWPYCARVCPYCDFNVVRARGREHEARRLADAILVDLETQAVNLKDRPLVSIFLGGGTPSLMDPVDVERLIAMGRRLWPMCGELEVTLEANPADSDRFAVLAAAGVNRLSLGVQSLDDGDLAFLGRDHDAPTARRALAAAMAIFRRVSVDLIYALPGQTPKRWAASLRHMADFGVEHISPYQLTIEPGTAFDRAVRRRVWSPPPSDQAAALYETTQRVLGDLGFDAYEVSNHARGQVARSRHNQLYWRGEDWLGIGPGAHGRITRPDGRLATEAPRNVSAYIDLVNGAGQGSTDTLLGPKEAALERLIMGLRTIDGVDIGDLAPLAIPARRIAELARFVTQHGQRLTATRHGRPVLDRVIAELADAA